MHTPKTTISVSDEEINGLYAAVICLADDWRASGEDYVDTDLGKLAQKLLRARRRVRAALAGQEESDG